MSLLYFLQVIKVNLIITDYCMPGMTGFELLKIVKVFKDFLIIGIKIPLEKI